MKNFISEHSSIADFTKACQKHSGSQAHVRLKEILDSLMAHLHNFVKEVELTPDEWLTACQSLAKAGQISDERRNEFILISDVLGIESLVDTLAHSRAEQSSAESKPLGNVAPTSSAILGPFFREGAPQLSMGSDIVQDHSTVDKQGKPGETALMFGRVIDVHNNPIAGATIDVWHDAVNGYYEQQDPGQPEFNCRGQFITGIDGSYSFKCLKPVAYPIPYDSTAGDMLKGLDRSPMRPAHIHMFVKAPGYKSLITQVSNYHDQNTFESLPNSVLLQIFDRSCPFIENDSVFATKDDLIVEFIPSHSTKAKWELEYDICVTAS